MTLVGVGNLVWEGYSIYRERRALPEVRIWAESAPNFGMNERVQTETISPAWLQPLLGARRIKSSGVFERAYSVSLARWAGGSAITDSEIAHLSALTNLRILYLDKTAITDAGLAHLRGLTNLRQLHLDGTGITDAGFVHLRGMKKLEYLRVGDTAVTDAGLVHLTGLKNLEDLYLSGTKVSDAGVVHLLGFPKIKCLFLYETLVTEQSAGELQKLLPRCDVRP